MTKLLDDRISLLGAGAGEGCSPGSTQVPGLAMRPEKEAAPGLAGDAGAGPRSVDAEREPVRAWSNGLDWPVIGWLAIVHLGALAAPFCFTWVGLLTFCFLSWVTGSLGVCLGYHRLLTHSSFQTFTWVRRLFGLLGTLAGEGPPINWVSVRRPRAAPT